ncbi:hypothetical protein [Micromonospora maritima]|nr:hypothetical protein [Micromonospora maritima]
MAYYRGFTHTYCLVNDVAATDPDLAARVAGYADGWRGSGREDRV